MAVPNLTRDDAPTRAELLHVDSYDIVLDLTDGGGKPSERTFRSTTTVTFTARDGAGTFIDVIADSFHSVTLNGLTQGTLYRYRISASDDAGAAAQSAIVNASPVIQALPPISPSRML